MKANSAGYKPTDLDRVYWQLAMAGPQSLIQIRTTFNWTTWRTNQALYLLRKAGDVRVTRGLRHRLYHAVLDTEVRERANCRLIGAVLA